MLKYTSLEERVRLLSNQNSRQNKLWIAARHIADGKYLEWQWAGKPFRSRLCFRFRPEEDVMVANSFDEDVLPTYKLQVRTEVC